MKHILNQSIQAEMVQDAYMTQPHTIAILVTVPTHHQIVELQRPWLIATLKAVRGIIKILRYHQIFIAKNFSVSS